MAAKKKAKAEVIENSESATLVATEVVLEDELRVEDLADLPTSEVSEADFIAEDKEEKEEKVEDKPEPSQNFDYNDIVTFRNKSGHLRHGVFGKITAMGYEAIELFKIK